MIHTRLRIRGHLPIIANKNLDFHSGGKVAEREKVLPLYLHFFDAENNYDPLNHEFELSILG